MNESKRNNLTHLESKADLFFRIVPSAIFMVDLEKRITGWNDMAEKITGFAKEEVIGKECTLFALEPCIDGCGLFNEEINKPICGKNCTIKTKTGELRHISKNVEYIYDEAGNVAGGIESFQDITEIILTETELRKSEEKFKAIWGGSIDGMRITDSEGKILMINDTYSQMLGFESEDLLGKPFTIAYKERQESILKKYKDSFEKKILSPRFETHLKLWNNKKRWFSVSQSFVKINDQETVLSVLRDITEAKKSEIINSVIYDINNAVYEIEDFTQLLAKICDILNRIVKSENFFIALYNKGDETISLPYLVDKYDNFDSIPIEGTATGYVIKTEEALLMNEAMSEQLEKEGKIKLVGTPSKIWLGVPIRVRNEVVGVVVMQDYEDEEAIGEEEREVLEFTSDQIGIGLDRIMSRNELIKSEKKLREANDTKDRFFSILSHDLKNPFVTIKGYLEILTQDFDELTEEEKKSYLLVTSRAAENTFELLQTLLTWSRSQRGKLEINKSDVLTIALVRKAIDPLIATAQKKNIKIISDLPLNEQVSADIFMIETVIRNLVSNAIKFTREGGEIKIKSRIEGTDTVIVVQDNGTGMKKDTVEKLFRIDVKTTTKGTKEEEGTGLGLVLCKEFIEKHGGKIWVESEPGVGSSFFFTIPGNT